MSAIVTRLHARRTATPSSPAASRAPTVVNDNQLVATARTAADTVELETLLLQCVRAYIIVVLGIVTCIAVLIFILFSPLLALLTVIKHRAAREYLLFLLVIGGSIAVLQFLEIATGHAP